jgi:hypothetical protein
MVTLASIMASGSSFAADPDNRERRGYNKPVPWKSLWRRREGAARLSVASLRVLF